MIAKIRGSGKEEQYVYFQLSFQPVRVSEKAQQKFLALEEVGTKIASWNDQRLTQGRPPLYGSLEFYRKGLIRPQKKSARFQNGHARILYAGTGPSSNWELREALDDLSSYLLKNLKLTTRPTILLPSVDFQS